MTAKHHVLNPVGEGPTGGGARLDTDAERRVAVGDHGRGKREQLVEGGGNFVAVGLEASRLVPDERLEVGLVGHAVLGAVDVAEAHGAIGPVLADRFSDGVGQRHDVAITGEVSELAGLREDRDVGRGAGLDLHVDLRLPVGGTDVEDRHVVGLGEDVERALQTSNFGWRADRTGDSDSGSGERVDFFTSGRGGGFGGLSLSGCSGSLSFRGLGLGSVLGSFGLSQCGFGVGERATVVRRVVVRTARSGDERQGEQCSEQPQQGAFHWFPSRYEDVALWPRWCKRLHPPETLPQRSGRRQRESGGCSPYSACNRQGGKCNVSVCLRAIPRPALRRWPPRCRPI